MSKTWEFHPVQELRNREGDGGAEVIWGGAGRKARSLPGCRAGAGDSRPTWEPPGELLPSPGWF